MPGIESTHANVIDLQQRMLADSEFRELCLANKLPWDPSAGYEPRWYNGPEPSKVRLLFLMAEPGPITSTEALNLRPAVTADPWIHGVDLSLQETYWLGNLRQLCRHIWPDDTEAQMDSHVGGSCTFWMSLRHGSTTDSIRSPILRYFRKIYLEPFMNLFPNAVILAAGAKARDRLKPFGIEFIECSAFTRPESNKPRARDSWRQAGEQARSLLGIESRCQGGSPLLLPSTSRSFPSVDT